MIVICGGGTGGHLAIARSFCEELNRRGIKPIFIGSTSGQDKFWFENDDKFAKKFLFFRERVLKFMKNSCFLPPPPPP